VNLPTTSRGLPPRIVVPIVVVAGIGLVLVIAYFLRIGLGVTGSALGPSAQTTNGAVPPIATRAPGEAAVPQSSAPSGTNAALPGKPVGVGGPPAAVNGPAQSGTVSRAAGGPPPAVMQLLAGYRARLAKNPNDRGALIGLASLEAQVNRFDTAAPLYARAITLKPSDIATRTQYALALHGSGHDGEALTQLVVVLRERPSDGDALYDEGVIAESAGRHTMAIAAFRRFLQVAPNDARAAQARSALQALGTR